MTSHYVTHHVTKVTCLFSVQEIEKEEEKKEKSNQRK